jgi:hypothetical protein
MPGATAKNGGRPDTVGVEGTAVALAVAGGLAVPGVGLSRGRKAGRKEGSDAVERGDAKP